MIGNVFLIYLIVNQTLQICYNIYITNFIRNITMNSQSTSSTKYVIILVLFQIAILIFSLLGSFFTGAFFIVIRLIFLILAHCYKQSTSAAFYSILALIAGLYAFDPVGLFITGHGQQRTTGANLCCLIACVLCFGASYIAYLYKLTLEQEAPFQLNSRDDPNEGGLFGNNIVNNNLAYVNPNQGNRYPSLDNRVGGSNYNSNPYSRGQNSSFKPFTGQGYRIA